MFIRQTMFRGRIRPGSEEAFNQCLRERLIPLQIRFPGAQEVRVLRQNESDQDDPRFELILALRFPSKAAIATALASAVRLESRIVTKELLTMFEGDIIHTVFDASDHPVVTLDAA